MVIIEDKLMYQEKAPVPEEEYLIPFGQANILRRGRDITLIATSSMVQVAQKAADLLDRDGISAEIIDPRTIVPLDDETILEVGEKDEPRHRDRRRSSKLWRNGGDRKSNLGTRILPPRRAGPADGGYGRARPLLTGFGGSDSAEPGNGR